MPLYHFSMAKIRENSTFSTTSVCILSSCSHIYFKVFTNGLGYRHEPFQHCPQGEAHKRGKCWCDSVQNFGEHKQPSIPIPGSMIYLPDYEWYSCLNRYDKLFS